jgi:hypothetical protein
MARESVNGHGQARVGAGADSCADAQTDSRVDESGGLSTGDIFVDGWAISVVCTSTKNGPHLVPGGVTGTNGPGTLMLTVPVNYDCVVTEATDIFASPVLPLFPLTIPFPQRGEEKTTNALRSFIYPE